MKNLQMTTKLPQLKNKVLIHDTVDYDVERTVADKQKVTDRRQNVKKYDDSQWKDKICKNIVKLKIKGILSFYRR